MDSDLLHKNVAKQINTVVSKDNKPEESRVLTIEETDLFLEAASHYRYFNAFSLALETGMHIREIIGLKWSDIDFANRTIYVNRTLVYIKSDDENSSNFNKWGFEFHEPKADKGRRKIPMTLKAYQILKRQLLWKRSIEAKGYEAPEGYEDLVFTTTKIHQSVQEIQHTAYTATHICNKVYREGHESENIADYHRTFYNPADNESLLPCHR